MSKKIVTKYNVYSVFNLLSIWSISSVKFDIDLPYRDHNILVQAEKKSVILQIATSTAFSGCKWWDHHFEFPLSVPEGTTDHM